MDPTLDPDQAQTPELAPDVQEAQAAPTPEVTMGRSGIPTDIETAIITCAQFYSKEDWGTRNIMVAFWKKLELYFEGIQRIYWAFDASDWRSIDSIDNSAGLDPTLYDKIINIYRAHGESLISALSIKLPTVVFYPDDADISEDVDTAKACSKIQELIEKHNEGPLIFMRALFYIYNQGVAAAYIYNRSSQEYGTVKVPTYGPDVNVNTYTHSCPTCGDMLGQDELHDNDQHPDFNGLLIGCDNCGMEVNPNTDVTSEQIPQIVAYRDEPKSKTCISIFGPMYAQMAFYARNQETLPYLRLKFEQHRTIIQDLYPTFRDVIPTYSNNDDSFGRWARAYSGRSGYEYSRNLVTTTCQWLRPFAFEILDNQELIDKCKAQFPNGCYAVLLGDSVVLEAKDENLDDHWEITHHPLSNYLHADPMGKPLAPVQELRNEAVDLSIDTFEHSIPETFADLEVLNFDKYQEEEAKPGMIYPVKSKMGKSIGDSFHSVKTATLSDEIDVFLKRVDTDGQFVVGDFPSIFGGPNTTGSKTAAEYAQSRAQAMQRLNVTWTMLKSWWAKTMNKAVQLYIKSMVTDDKYVMRSSQAQNGFLNIWIKQAELTGKIGRVEPDAEEELPTSLSQIKSTIIELVSLNNDYVNEGLFNPQNTPLLAKAIGLPDLYIPGQDNRDKQYAEIAELLLSGPVQGMAPMPQEGMQAQAAPMIPTVMPDETDDDSIHISTLKAWGTSSTGMAIKKMNPQGYANCMAHMHAHEQKLAMMTMQNQGQPPDSAVATTAQ